MVVRDEGAAVASWNTLVSRSLMVPATHSRTLLRNTPNWPPYHAPCSDATLCRVSALVCFTCSLAKPHVALALESIANPRAPLAVDAPGSDGNTCFC